jgi:hypothetical protein
MIASQRIKEQLIKLGPIIDPGDRAGAEGSKTEHSVTEGRQTIGHGLRVQVSRRPSAASGDRWPGFRSGRLPAPALKAWAALRQPAGCRPVDLPNEGRCRDAECWPVNVPRPWTYMRADCRRD